MVKPSESENAPRRLTWNLGGWLGAQLGGSAWMLIGAILAFLRDPPTGAVVLALFLAVQGVGACVWTRRRQISALSGIQILLGTLAITGVATIFILDRSGLFEEIQAGPTVSARASYATLLGTIAALMVLFTILNRKRA